ncbi:MAG TPA: response regulator [Vicinamibacterales bacterium]
MTSRPATLQKAAPAKPKVLLVDDHPEVLRSISRMLAFDFEIAALATDGAQALEQSRRVEPDVVVLDITMPGLDGFQTARELTRNGTGPRVVFLTMHDAEEFITEGFRSGGRGYVVKTRVHEDLVRAIDRVLAGQMFVPSLKSLFLVDEASCGHAAQFYSDDRAFVDSMGDFLDVALRCGDTVSVVANESFRVGLAEQLNAHGWSVGESGEHGRYRAMDSGEALASIMCGDRLDANRLEQIVDDLERSRVALAEGHTRRHTMVGDLLVPLFLNGNARAGMEVERLWNDLTHALPFMTVCCYPAACFDAQSRDTLPDVCAEHWAVA